MKVFVATNTETFEGQERTFYLLGVYSTKEEAIACLRRQAEEDMSLYDEEDQSRFTTREDGFGGFSVSDGYNTYQYCCEERYLDDKEDE